MNGKTDRRGDDSARNPAHDVMVQERPVPRASASDLEDFEKFFREQFATPAGAAPAVPGVVAAAVPSDDPLMAELARIVGQEVRPAAAAAPRLPQAHDPFVPPAATQAAPETPPHDQLKAFEEELRRFDEEQRARHAPQPVPEVHSLDPAHAAAYETGHYEGAPAQGYVPVEPQHGAAQDDLRGTYPAGADRPLPGDELAVPPPMLPPDAGQPRSRRMLVILGTAGAVMLAGVVGTLGFRGPAKTAGQAPVITAKTSPTKEKPADPGGVEISGQDRQVLARRTEDPKAGASVVNKEEQPVDLNQTPKRDAVRVIPPAGGTQTAATPSTSVPILMPAGSAPAQPSAGTASATAGTPANPLEPRRVRSVRINGEGESAAPAAAAAQPPAAPRPPSLASAPPPVAAAPAAPKSDARPTPSTRTTTTPAATTTPQPARAQPAARPAPAPQQTADAEEGGSGPLSLRPSGTSAAAPARTAAATPQTQTASAGGSGSFAVQFRATPSESEARAAANEIKQQYAGVLSGYSPSVRQATVNDRTVYRVRVGNLSRDAATNLCNKLKADGGTCFVASN